LELDCKFHNGAYLLAGKYIKLAQVVRAKTQLEHLQSEIASVARKTGISSATKLALIAPSVDLTEDVPDVEWWDAAILPGKR
jgi:U4/U6 small nuclear ribonucleoprotein PRP3